VYSKVKFVFNISVQCQSGYHIDIGQTGGISRKEGWTQFKKIFVWNILCVVSITNIYIYICINIRRPGRGADPLTPLSAEFRKSRGVPLLTLRAFVAYKKRRNAYINIHNHTQQYYLTWLPAPNLHVGHHQAIAQGHEHIQTLLTVDILKFLKFYKQRYNLLNIRFLKHPQSSCH